MKFFFFLMFLCVGSCVCSRFKMEKRSLVTIVSQTDVQRTPEKYGGEIKKHTKMTIKRLSRANLCCSAKQHIYSLDVFRSKLKS